jgi:hypothetical protein
VAAAAGAAGSTKLAPAREAARVPVPARQLTSTKRRAARPRLFSFCPVVLLIFLTLPFQQ